MVSLNVTRYLAFTTPALARPTVGPTPTSRGVRLAVERHHHRGWNAALHDAVGVFLDRIDQQLDCDSEDIQKNLRVPRLTA